MQKFSSVNKPSSTTKNIATILGGLLDFHFFLGIQTVWAVTGKPMYYVESLKR